MNILSQPHVFMSQMLDAPAKSKIATNLQELHDNQFIKFELNANQIGEKVPENSSLDDKLTAHSTLI